MANKIFPTDGHTNLSAEFTVGSTPVAIRVFNASNTDDILLEQVIHVDCGQDVVGPVRMCCQVKLGFFNTLYVLAISGTYRLFVNNDPVNDELAIYVDELALCDAKASTPCCA